MKLSQLNWIKYLIFVPIVVSLALYFSLHSSFFQGDEWWSIGYGYNQSYVDVFKRTDGGWTPLSNFVAIFFAKQFHTNPAPWAWLSLISHTINGVLVYLIATKLSGRRSAGLIASLIFIILPAHSQMVRHFALAPVLPSISLMLGSLYLVLSRRYWLGLIVAGIALFLTGYYATALVPPYFIFLLLMGWRHKEDRSQLWQLFLISLAFFFAYVMIVRDLSALPATASLAAGTESLWQKLVGIFIDRPLVMLPQLFWPYQQTIDVPAVWWLGLSILIGSLLLTGLLFATKRKELGQAALVGILFVVSSYLYFAVVRQVPLEGAIASRYLYIPALGLAILLGSLLAGLPTEKKYDWQWAALAVVCMVAFWSWYKQSALSLKGDIEVGQARIRVIDEYQRVMPSIPRRALIYMSSNAPGHFGVPSTVIPVDFLPTWGYVVAVSQYAGTPLQKEIVGNPGVALNPSLEWAMKKGEEIFAYTHTPEKTAVYVDQYDLSIEEVYGFFFDEETKTMKDISSTFREEIRVRLTPQ